MKLSIEEIEALERVAESGVGHCPTCQQTIKIYRYKINKVHVSFLRAMANAVQSSGNNNVDIAEIGIPYSTRSQSSKMRQHGLIARVKDERGVQVPRRWLITHKGWNFLNGRGIAEKVVVYNNQVLGHSGPSVVISEVSGEPVTQTYEPESVTAPEARALADVRKPSQSLLYQAIYKGPGYGVLKIGDTYNLSIDRLQIGKPVLVTVKEIFQVRPINYKDIAAFQKDWRIV